MSSSMHVTIQRRRILIQGIVQGVGFRPFVYGLALRHDLKGFVLNDSRGVTIEVEGVPAQITAFCGALSAELPPLARIDSLITESVELCYDTAFVIAQSQSGQERQALISPDTATCAECLSELFDPQNRRYRYPFINCTNCGPRFTIVEDVPYDREKTTMRPFTQCPACQQEYEDPLNRRFHAQPNACPVCGPHVRLVELPSGEMIASAADPIVAAAHRIASGSVLAIKGLGGYHLACNALDDGAVRRLRQRKHREARPFAVMVADLATIQALCLVSEGERALLQSRQRPIVLLQRRADCPVAAEVAPQGQTLGMMLPYTPLHHLLLRTFAEESHGPAVLVMTSGNLSEEPIAYRDEDAYVRLAEIADSMLTHNRAIYIRCDDSVLRVAASEPQFFRRSRSYAPEPLPLPVDCPVPLLACGAHLKNTFCLGKQRQAFISHHIGDLENMETLTSFREGIVHFQRLFAITPEAVAYDLHPEYLATKYALEMDVPHKVGVQHHHAHIASVMAEYGLSEPVIGVAADGTGYGSDGAVWGGEILLADLTGFERMAHLAYVPLPGGEQAIRQPWRCAAAYLAQSYGDTIPLFDLDIPFVRKIDPVKWDVLKQMIDRKINSPPTSSLGRLFDAIAALLGVRSEVQYEGQAAIELEMLAESGLKAVNEGYPFAWHDGEPAIFDVSPTLMSIVEDIRQSVTPAWIAARFHLTMVDLLAFGCERVREQSGINTVVLSGGVFQNRILLERLVALLEAWTFQVYVNRLVPPNDGGLSLGQLVVAATHLRRL